jgi:ketosteroid isomerase-like protein
MNDAANTTSEVLQTARRLVDAFASFDRTAYFAAFHSDANFIFYNLDVVHPDRASYERAWDEWVASGERIVSCRSENPNVKLLDDTTAVFTHEVFTTLGSANTTTDLHERETIVFSKFGDTWLAVHEHLSPFPE